MNEFSFRLGVDQLDTATLFKLAQAPSPKIIVTEDVRSRVEVCRAQVEDILLSSKRVYGVNTGFGFLSDVKIEKEKLQQLQINLVRSHACGVGEPIDHKIVRALLILRAHTFLLGYSGVRWKTVESVLVFLKHDILPIIPSQGSVGASGDLAPLAHLARALMGEGKVFYRGEVRDSASVLKELSIDSLKLEAKEGLSLINGTHFMTAIASFAVEEAKNLVATADAAAALSLDAIRGSLAAFDPRIHELRRHKGQQITAANIRSLFSGKDAIVESHKDCGKVQDPYSFRCVPQVHGATRDVLKYVEETINRELNAITDNPLVFSNSEVISGGNFHGQPVALAMDFLAIAVAELGSISERRIEKITNPNLSGLPPFATHDSGLNSGFMIPHVVAAALVSENKVLCHPASIDSIPTSADKEDHVSMGPISARKARMVGANVCRVLSVEILAACQGIDLLSPLRPSDALNVLYNQVRSLAPRMECDRSMADEIEAIANWISTGGVTKALESISLTL